MISLQPTAEVAQSSELNETLQNTRDGEIDPSDGCKVKVMRRPGDDEQPGSKPTYYRPETTPGLMMSWMITMAVSAMSDVLLGAF